MRRIKQGWPPLRAAGRITEIGDKITALSALPKTIYLQKLSDLSSAKDCPSLAAHYRIKPNALPHDASHGLWRCRYGLKGRWHYAMSLEECIDHLFEGIDRGRKT